VVVVLVDTALTSPTDCADNRGSRRRPNIAQAFFAGVVPPKARREEIVSGEVYGRGKVTEAGVRMSTDVLLAAFQDFQLVVRQHTATKLLNADNAASYCAIFQARFMTGEPVIAGPRFMELVASDLSILRAEGLELPGTTEDRVTGWVRDGYLIRSVIEGRATEQYQLSVGAVEAVAYLQGLVSRSSTATESTMSLMVEEIVRIDVDSNPDSKERIKDLHRQQAALQKRIAAVENGTEEPIDTTKVVERLNAARALGAKMPTDVSRYGDGIKELDRTIRMSAEDEATITYNGILQALFDGEDALSNSDEGAAFQSFFSYLMNPRLRARLSSALDNISRREVAGASALATEVDRLISSIAAQAHEVKALQGALNRSLRRFIQSREYLLQRSVRENLLEAQRSAHAAMDHVNPNRGTGLHLNLRRLDLASIGLWRLKANFAGKPPVLAQGQSGLSSPSEFARLYPIDRDRLRQLVNEHITSSGGAASCAEIINNAPSPLHLAEVAYICDLALEHGMRDPDGRETAMFATGIGLKAIELPYLLVTEPVPAHGHTTGSNTAFGEESS
jgi:hypothetical protein